jgi:uncharacterized surface protein with fasciclin (FAS1) repeats
MSLKQNQTKSYDMKKNKTMMAMIAIATALFITNVSFAQTGTMSEQSVEVGGAPMYASRDIVSNAVNSKAHTTLVAAVKAAGLVSTLQSPGPFTVFAPTNQAFDMLPEGTVNTLLKPENKATLTNVLTYHVVAGKYNAADITKLIKAGNGSATLKTVAGGTLTIGINDKRVVIKDEKGGQAYVTIADVNQSNGVIHVIDHVLLPK